MNQQSVFEEMRVELARDPASCYSAFRNQKEALECATELGVDVRFPTNRELFLDFDTKDYPLKYKELLALVDSVWKIAGYYETQGVSGRGRHVRIELEQPLSDTLRIPLQVMLGFDPMRELLHWTSWARNCPYVQVLFEKPGYEETPIDWTNL